MGMLDPAQKRDSQTTNQSLLLAYIAANDVACPVCGYNLRARTSDMYPECGQRFGLRVGSESVRFGQFLLFLAPLIMQAGLALFFLILMLTEPWFPRWPAQWGIYAICIAGVADGMLILLLYHARQRVFFRRSRHVQGAMTWLTWITQSLIAVVSVGFGTK